MATQTENLIKALEIEVGVLKDRVEALRGEVKELPKIIADVQLLEHRLDEIAKTKELWGQRGWMVLTICLSAFFSLLAVVFGSFLTYYLNTRK